MADMRCPPDGAKSAAWNSALWDVREHTRRSRPLPIHSSSAVALGPHQSYRSMEAQLNTRRARHRSKGCYGGEARRADPTSRHNAATPGRLIDSATRGKVRQWGPPSRPVPLRRAGRALLQKSERFFSAASALSAVRAFLFEVLDDGQGIPQSHRSVRARLRRRQSRRTGGFLAPATCAPKTRNSCPTSAADSRAPPATSTATCASPPGPSESTCRNRRRQIQGVTVFSGGPSVSVMLSEAKHLAVTGALWHRKRDASAP